MFVQIKVFNRDRSVYDREEDTSALIRADDIAMVRQSWRKPEDNKPELTVIFLRGGLQPVYTKESVGEVFEKINSLNPNVYSISVDTGIVGS